MASQLNETRGELRARRLNVPVKIKIQIGVSLGAEFSPPDQCHPNGFGERSLEER